jgi:RNA polymerase-binding transcription factor DksA
MKRLRASNQNNKEQIAAIGERVKRALAKTDSLIERLKDKLRECEDCGAKISEAS